MYTALFLSATGLAWEACLKKTEIRLKLIFICSLWQRMESDEEFVMQYINK